MNGNDHTDDGDEEQYGVNRAGDKTADEIRQNAIDALADCDGAIVVTASVDEDDEAIIGSAIKFVRDDLGDDREQIHYALMENAMETAKPDGVGLASLGGDDLTGLLAALMGGGGPGGMNADLGDEDDDDGDHGSMFA